MRLPVAVPAVSLCPSLPCPCALSHEALHPAVALGVQVSGWLACLLPYLLFLYRSIQLGAHRHLVLEGLDASLPATVGPPLWAHPVPQDLWGSPLAFTHAGLPPCMGVGEQGWLLAQSIVQKRAGPAVKFAGWELVRT